MPASKSFEYKFVKMNDNGVVVWDSGANRSLTTPASNSVTLDEVFR